MESTCCATLYTTSFYEKPVKHKLSKTITISHKLWQAGNRVDYHHICPGIEHLSRAGDSLKQSSCAFLLDICKMSNVIYCQPQATAKAIAMPGMLYIHTK